VKESLDVPGTGSFLQNFSGFSLRFASFRLRNTSPRFSLCSSSVSRSILCHPGKRMREVTFRGQSLGPNPAERLQTHSGDQTVYPPLEKTFAWYCESRVLPAAFFQWDLPVSILQVQAVLQVQTADVPRFPQLVRDVVNAGHRVCISYSCTLVPMPNFLQKRIFFKLRKNILSS